jgi:predicted Zn-dependent protease
MTNIIPLDRRRLLTLLAAGGLVGACTENAATGRRQFMLVSDEQLAELSAQAWRDAVSQLPRSTDAGLQARLAKVGGAVAEASGRTEMDWEFVVFEDPRINAFVLPGGKVGFFSGLLEFAGDDDQIGAVMGHEAGHVVARHAAERVSQQLATQVGVAIAEAALSEEYGENAGAIAGALGAGVMYGVILPYSRKHEFEADALGVGLAARAGLDPAGAPRFWERMLAQGKGSQVPAFLSTHPADSDRLSRLRDVVAKA